ATNSNWQPPTPQLSSLLVESILAKALGQDSAQSAVAEKRDLLERLLARLAHEIRNPLSSLDIHVQLLEEDLAALAPGPPDAFPPAAQHIHRSLPRLKTRSPPSPTRGRPPATGAGTRENPAHPPPSRISPRPEPTPPPPRNRPPGKRLNPRNHRRFRSSHSSF